MRRKYSIDFLKFFAAFGVVAIHANPFSGISFWGIDGDMLDFLIDTSARIGVPLFFAISGYLFSKKLVQTDGNITFVKHYLWKIAKLYLTWITVYIIYDMLLLFITEGNLSSYISEHWSFTNFIYFGNPSTVGILWYLTALIWSSGILYIFFKINKMTVLLILSTITHFIGIIQAKPDRDAVFIGLFYLVMGYYISKYEDILIRKIRPLVAMLLSCLLFVTQIIERLKLPAGEYFFSTIILVILIFGLALKYGEFGKGTLIAKIGSQSVGIYVLHFLLLKIVLLGMSFINKTSITETIGWQVLFAPFIFATSYILYNLLQHIKTVVKQNIKEKIML